MKKLLALLLSLTLLLAAVPAFAADDVVTVMLDGEVIECTDVNGNKVDPVIIDGTTYLPIRAIANALDLDVQWDDATKTVFINGVSVLAKKTDVINIFINGGRFIPTDVNGNVVNPIIIDGTTYVPVRAIGEAFDKEVAWDGETKTVTLTTKAAPVIETTVISKDKTYAFINKATGKALTATDHYTLEYTDFTESAAQGFKFVPCSDIDGFYFIRSISNGQCFDVSGHSTTPGGEIITWDSTGADNQKFAYKDVEGGVVIYSYSSGLPVEATDTNTIQSSMTYEPIQLWSIVEFEAPVTQVVQTTGAYRTFSISGNYLTDNGSLMVKSGDSSNSQKWRLVEVSDSEYLITNLATDMSVDVSGQSLNAGDPIITWYTSSDPNQRWILEKQGDNTYLIKSVHSGLYLTISNGTLVQTYRDSAAQQVWTMGYTD